jgi:hypothetical protein
MFIKKYLMPFFEEDSGGAGGGQGDGIQIEIPGKDTTPPADKTFTQADVDRIIGERLGREKEKFTTLESKVKAADAWVAENFGETHGIKTWDEYQEALKKEKERKSFQTASTDPDKLQELINKNVDDKINQHPAVKQANELIGKQHLQEEIDSLNKEYPELKIKNIDDLNKLPNIDKIYDRHINKGLSLLEAYEVVNRPQKVDVAKVKEDAVKEYFEKLKGGRRPVEGGGAAPVIVTEKPKTFEDARKGALEMLRQINKT